MSRRLETIFVGVDQMTDVLKKIERYTEATALSQSKQRQALEASQKATESNRKAQEKAVDGWTELKSKIDLAKGALQQVGQVLGKVVDFAQLGADVQRANDAINNLAAGFGQSGDEIVKSIQEASGYTIDGMSSIAAANKAMLLDVAKTPEDFARLSEQAVLLGRAMGQDAAKSIDDFVTAAGRQSKQIADNLGLMVSAEDANKRYAASHNTTVEAMDDAAKKQAFLQEMLRQAEIKTVDLSKSTGDLASDFEKLSAATKDAKDELALMFAEALTGAGDVDVLAGHIRAIPDAVRTYGKVNQMFLLLKSSLYGNEQAALDLNVAWRETTNWANEIVNAAQGMVKIEGAGWIDKKVAEGWEDRAAALNEYAQAIADAGGEAVGLNTTVPKLTAETERYLNALNETEQATLEWDHNTQNVAQTIELAEMEALKKARHEMLLYAQQRRETLLDTSMDWADYYKDQEEAAQDFADQRAQIESQHASNLAEIAAKGQAKRVQIDVEAEETKLESLKYNLDQAILKQAEMTGKEKESVVNAKNHAVQVAQEKYNTQAKLLEDFHAGRLVSAGQNVDGLLAEEQRRYDEELAMLETARSEQEQEQRASLGRMVLAQFEAWAQMNGVSSEEAYKMRLAIAEEYGLIDAGAAAAALNMQQTWEAWAANTNMSIDAVILRMRGAETAAADLKTAILNLPDKTVNIDVKINKQSIDYGGSIGAQGVEAEAAQVYAPDSSAGYSGTLPGMAMGGVASGGVTLVGEEGPELVELPPGSIVFDAQETADIFSNTLRGPISLGGGTPKWNTGGAAPVPIPGAPAAPAIGEATEVHYHYTNVMTIHIAGDVWSDAKVREIADAIERLAPQTGIRTYGRGYNA